VDPNVKLSQALGALEQAVYLFRDTRELLSEIEDRHPELF
jgi:hypothetical protein